METEQAKGVEKKKSMEKMMMLDTMISKKLPVQKFCDLIGKEKMKTYQILYIKSSHLSKNMIQNYLSTKKKKLQSFLNLK